MPEGAIWFILKSLIRVHLAPTVVELVLNLMPTPALLRARYQTISLTCPSSPEESLP